MISNDTKRRKDASGPATWFGNLPRPIRTEDGVDSRLAGFPANLLYSQIAHPKTDSQGQARSKLQSISRRSLIYCNSPFPFS
jgi:hypothetical protein